MDCRPAGQRGPGRSRSRSSTCRRRRVATALPVTSAAPFEEMSISRNGSAFVSCSSSRKMWKLTQLTVRPCGVNMVDTVDNTPGGLIMSSPTAGQQRSDANARTEAILEAVRRELAEVPAADLESVKDAAALGSRMVAMVPRSTGGPLGRIIGPVYSTNALTKMWNITRQGVNKRVKEGRLLTLYVQGKNLFPTFQFDGKRVREDVLHIVDLLRASSDPFTIAQWLRTPLVEAEGRTPLELLDAGESAQAENLAKRSASRWSA